VDAYLDVRRPPGARRSSGVPGRHAASPRPRLARPSRRAGRHGAAPLPTRWWNRAFAIGLLGGIALSLTIFQYQFRHLEADVVARLYGIVTPTLAASSAPIIWFGLGTAGAFGLVITPDCSSALLIVPLCGLGMLLMIPRKLPVGRVAKALVVSAALLVAGNLSRIGVIAVATRVGGIGAGYQFGHLVLGSVISIVCIAMSLTLLIAIVGSRDGVRLSALLRRHWRAA
jgi:exosortase/archaeosortase family protein